MLALGGMGWLLLGGTVLWMMLHNRAGISVPFWLDHMG